MADDVGSDYGDLVYGPPNPNSSTYGPSFNEAFGSAGPAASSSADAGPSLDDVPFGPPKPEAPLGPSFSQAFGDVGPASATTFDSDSVGPSSDTSSDVLTSSKTTATSTLTGSKSGSTDSKLDVGSIIKSATDAGASIAKSVAGLAVPPIPTPQVPVAPKAPALPASLPPTPPASSAQRPAAAPSTDAAAGKGAALGPPKPTQPSAVKPTGLSTGAKVAIGVGVGGLILGGVLVVAAGRKRR